MNRKELLLVLFLGALLVLEFFYFNDLPFFWDGISKASRANWIYENNFKNLILPTSFSSGHPPLWITSLAVFWKIFGQTLWASRFLLLIVNLGVFYQIFILCKHNFSSSVSIFMVLLVCLDPTLIAQTTSLNNDMMLLFFTLFSLNSLLKNKWLFYAIALTGLLLTNLRGIYCFIALILTQVLYVKKSLQPFNRKLIISYGVALIFFILFLIYQYAEVGWVIITKNENYSKHREVATVFRIFKNVAAFIKNLLDFGRIFLWVPLAIMLLKLIKNRKLSLDNATQKTIIPLFIFTIIFFVGFVPFSNPMGPRYLMICYILATIVFINLLQSFEISKKNKKWMLSLIALALISGHFWIYPPTISQAWDSSLAYLGYYDEEEKMLTYIDKNQLNKSEIGTNLPLNRRGISRLSTTRAQLNFSPLNLATNKYIIFSNVENSTSDESINELQRNWEEIKTYKSWGVFVTLYKNPNH